MSSLFHGVALRMIARQLPLRRGAKGSAEQNLHRSIGKRQFHGFVGILDTGHRKSPYQYSLNAPLKKSRPMKTGLQNRVVG